MENISQEQLMAIGIAGFAIIGVAILVSFLLMAGTLKLSISWLGNSSPSFVVCLGWLFAIAFVNSFVAFSAMAIAGQGAMLIATPLTWFVTAYMISSAANCGLLRGFGIWIVNSILSSIGLVVIVLIAAIPFAIIGAGVQAGGENLQAEFEQVEEMMAEMDEQLQTLEELESMELPEVTEVHLQAAIEDQPVEADDPQPAAEEPSNHSLQSVFGTRDAASESTSPQRSTKRQPTPVHKAKPSRAADGSTLNPFFQN